MPVNPGEPGVYIEELPSGVRTLVGASTSVAAFVDVFKQGPVNQAVKVSGPGDFERAFGGTFAFSESSYAIRQFFVNGGNQAWVVRIIPDDATKASAALPEESGGADFEVTAKSEGSWGDNLCIGIQYPDVEVDPDETFDLVVGVLSMVGNREVVQVREVFRNLSTDSTKSRYYVNVVNVGSALIDITDPGGGRPAETGAAPATTSGGASGGASGGTSGGFPAGEPDDLAASRRPDRFLAFSPGNDGAIDPNDGAFDDAAIGNEVAGDPTKPSGLWCLDTIAPEIFNILCLPVMAILDEDACKGLITAAADFCERRRAMLLVDPPKVHDDATTPSALSDLMVAFTKTVDPHPNVAAYFPRLVIPDPLGRTRNVGPSGTVAGIYARTDTQRGVWKAPAGTAATLRGATPVLTTTDAVSRQFNPIGVNVLRVLPVFQNVVWGARTRDGADLAASQFKYVPVRRLALYIEQSLKDGLQWVVFEPNDEPLWSQIRLNVGAFMQRLFRQGAFAGTTPNEAYLVKCDSDTTTADDVSRGVVNLLVGFQPLLPCEFVIIQIQQLTRPQEA